MSINSAGRACVWLRVHAGGCVWMYMCMQGLLLPPVPTGPCMPEHSLGVLPLPAGGVSEEGGCGGAEHRRGVQLVRTVALAGGKGWTAHTGRGASHPLADCSNPQFPLLLSSLTLAPMPPGGKPIADHSPPHANVLIPPRPHTHSFALLPSPLQRLSLRLTDLSRARPSPAAPAQGSDLHGGGMTVSNAPATSPRPRAYGTGPCSNCSQALSQAARPVLSPGGMC
ncbi:hypothetical protein DR999_PMT19928 [Platysternon megacephalum]|uniref:Uncharacterized protein n=1 Tax=Platysternon megacephalum TaxID=55544 RepID=A0A4D9DL15_9SAUR|nr:hypothetical protein DR999_PMT19928 [Platysternon megacephalum]